MSDETIIVENQGTIFLAGPPLVKAATGEDVTPEELGGGAMHSRISGVTDHLAADDEDALRIMRNIVETLPESKPTPWKRSTPVAAPRPQEDLYDIVPTDPKIPYDAHEVIETLCDEGSLSEFKSEYGNSIITTFARLEGHQVGVIANLSLIHI